MSFENVRQFVYEDETTILVLISKKNSRTSLARYSLSLESTYPTIYHYNVRYLQFLLNNQVLTTSLEEMGNFKNI